MAEARGEALLGIEDWLAHAGEPERRYELIDGRLVAMNPPEEWHGVIANEIGRLCAEALRDRFPCRAQQQAGIEIRREPEGWPKPEAFIGRASFESRVLGVTVALDEIYRFVPFG